MSNGTVRETKLVSIYKCNASVLLKRDLFLAKQTLSLKDDLTGVEQLLQFIWVLINQADQF